MSLILNSVVLITLFIMGLLMPELTRKEIFFGIRIPEGTGEKDELKAIKIDYKRNYVLSCGIYIVLLVAAMAYFNSVFIFTFGILLYLLLSFANYYAAYTKVKSLKSKQNWEQDKKQVVAVDTGFRNKKMLVSAMWFLVPLCILIVNVVIVMTHYNSLPNRIPLHLNEAGIVDRWTNKSYASVLEQPAIQLILIVFMFMIYKFIGIAKQQISVANPEESREQNRLFRLRWSGFIIFMTTLITVSFMIINLKSLGILAISNSLANVISMWFVVVIILTSITLSVATGQGGSRIKIVAAKDKKDGFIDRNDDRYWKFGTVYYNPNDPAFMVEKRFGVGWTVNFGRPLGWAILIGLPLVILLVHFIFNSMAK